MADVHRESELRERVELRLQLLEALLDELQLARSLLVRVERLLLLVEVGLQGADVDAHVLELLGQRVDLRLGVGELRVLVVLLGLQLVVLGELRLPLVLRVATTDGQEGDRQNCKQKS